MSEKTIFYLVDNPLRLCVLEPAPGGFHAFKIDNASLARLLLEVMPHVHQALIAKIADQTPAP